MRLLILKFYLKVNCIVNTNIQIAEALLEFLLNLHSFSFSLTSSKVFFRYLLFCNM